MSAANSQNWAAFIREVCTSLAIIFAAAGGPVVFRGVRNTFQNAEKVTSQFMDRLGEELTWRLSCGGV